MPADYTRRISSYANRPDAERMLFFLAAGESIFLPTVADTILIHMTLLSSDKAWRYGFIATLGSVLGGMLAFALGWGLYMTIGQGLVAMNEWESAYHIAQTWYNRYDVVATLAAGFSPFPFKIIALLNGFFVTSLAQFIIAALIARGARYFLMVWLLWRGGPRMKEWIERRFYSLTMANTLLLLLLFILLKYVVT